MPLPAGVLAKTDKGIEEIRTRAFGLAQKQRALLILIDGRLTAQDMLARFPSIGDVEQMLQVLIDQGFVRAAGGKGAPAPRNDRDASPRAAADADALAAGVRGLSRMLYDMIGPSADDFTAKLERARDRESFVQAAQAGAAIAESFGGKRKADAFREQAKALAERLFTGRP